MSDESKRRSVFANNSVLNCRTGLSGSLRNVDVINFKVSDTTIPIDLDKVINSTFQNIDIEMPAKAKKRRGIFADRKSKS